MANIEGPQPDILHCPACQKPLRNVLRHEMRSPGYVRRDGTVSPDTHTYHCDSCHRRFEINQER
jgi:uncharacterized protein YbaR (Trm112 family)